VTGNQQASVLRQALVRALPWLAWLLVLGVYVVHLGQVGSHAVNIPYWDEWEFLHPEQAPNLEGAPSLSWLLARHNEHVILTTKLQVWILYRLSGWDLVSQVVSNFLLFGLLVGVIACLCVRMICCSETSWVVAAFCLFLLSPLGWENHRWGFQSQFHVAMLAFLVACAAGFAEPERRRPWFAALCSGAALLAIASQSAGLAACVLLLPCLAVYRGLRAWRAENRSLRQGELALLAILVTVIGGACVLWEAGRPQLSHHPALTLPWTATFWAYFLDLVGLGFGITESSAALGAGCLLLVVVPLIGCWVRRTGSEWARWTLTAVVLGSLGCLASIVIGRAGLGLESAKSSRYFAFACLLVPFSFVAWRLFLADLARDHPKLERARAPALIALWIVCAVGFKNDWSFAVYAEQAKQRRAGLACVERYYAEGGMGRCPQLYPAPLARRLEEARRLKVSFTSRTRGQ